MAERPKFLRTAIHRPIQKPGRPFVCSHVDLFYLPKSEKTKYTAVMLVIDSFSKWIEAHLLKDTRALTVWAKFESKIIFRFGSPGIVVSDNGTEF